MEWSNSTSMLALLLLLLPTVLVCCITTALIVVMMRRRTSEGRLSRKLRPPGPRALPIIGHLHLVGKKPHRSFYELSKAHGPLMWLRLGSVPTVVASSPKMARLILKTHDGAFADRMQNAAVKLILGGHMDIAYSPPNAEWRFLRQLCATELFSTKHLNAFKSVREEQVRLLMRFVYAGSRKPQCVTRKLRETTNDIIMRMMLGKKLSELEYGIKEASRIVDLLCDLPALVGMFNVGDYLPFLAWMDLQGCVRRSKSTIAPLRAAIEGLIQARRLSNKDQELRPKDYLDLLLEASTHTPINVVNICLDLFSAGTDGSSSVVEWALAELLSNPEKMQALQEEIDEVVGKERMIEEDDIAHLPYLVACVKETMRLHPILPFLVPHKTNQACDVLGFHIPANTLTFVNVWAIGRDPKVWESPTDFLPERFLGESPYSGIDVQGQQFELIPFGSGRRICPGWRMGLLSVQIILASLLQGFEWSIPPSHHLDMSESCGLYVILDKPLVAFTTPRLPTEFY